MRLFIVDGSNIVMRCALGGEIRPVESVKTALNMIARAAREFEVSHLIVALDCPGAPSWRKQLFPDYKAHRTVDTSEWITAMAEACLREDWWLEAQDGFEADDIIATVATRARERGQVLVLSGDSDLLPLTGQRIEVVKPVNGGRFTTVTPDMVCERYGLNSPGALVDLKALAGEAGDNLPGVDGIGRVRGQQLLALYQDVEGVIAAGQRNACKFSARVAAAADVARLCRRLATLVYDVPVAPITPNGCVFAGGAA